MTHLTTCRLDSYDRPLVPGRQSRLLLGAGTLVVCVAGILALTTALECHTVATQASPGASLAPSLIYGAVLWLWWAGIAHILWRISRRRPAVLSLSAKTVAKQIVIAVAITGLHLTALQWTVHHIVRVWPALESAGYSDLRFADIGRCSIDFLIYALLWTACAVINMQLAAQRDAMQALLLRQQLSAAHLRTLQMQLEPHFLFNTLNAITTLIEVGRNAEASETLSHLNFILKAMLARGRPERVSLATELEIATRKYEQGRMATVARHWPQVKPAFWCCSVEDLRMKMLPFTTINQETYSTCLRVA